MRLLIAALALAMVVLCDFRNSGEIAAGEQGDLDVIQTRTVLNQVQNLLLLQFVHF